MTVGVQSSLWSAMRSTRTTAAEKKYAITSLPGV